MESQNTQRYSKVDLFSIKGRMGKRYYFFYSAIISLIFLLVISRLLIPTSETIYTGSSYFLGLVGIISASILVFLTIQRCHDFDKSAWFALFVVIPFFHLIYSITSSTNGLNRYGEVPESAPILITIINYLIIALFIFIASYLLFHFLR